MYVNTYVYTYRHTYVYTYVYTHVYTYTCGLENDFETGLLMVKLNSLIPMVNISRCSAESEAREVTVWQFTSLADQKFTSMQMYVYMYM